MPQTFIAILDNEVVGMYQIAMSDDLHCRPDLYPWLINVFVDENHREKGVCRKMMQSVLANAKSIEINELYLYKTHWII